MLHSIEYPADAPGWCFRLMTANSEAQLVRLSCVAKDLLLPGLSVVFCGYNPSLSAGRDYHYAHPSSRFWRLLHAAGITERPYEPQEDELLLDRGIGFTNLAPRPTRRAEELTREEIRAGARQLRAKLKRYRPRSVAYAGIGLYRWFRSITRVQWGLQDTPAVAGVADVVVPSPSGLNRMTFEDLLEHYRFPAVCMKRVG